MKFGLDRAAGTPLNAEDPPTEIVLATIYDGVPVYADRYSLPKPRFVYVPLDAECNFQTYAQEQELR